MTKAKDPTTVIRPHKGGRTIRVVCHVTPDIAAKLQSLKQTYGLSNGDFLTQAVEAITSLAPIVDFTVTGEVMEKINSQAVYDLLRGIAVAIYLTMTEAEAEELIEQINAQDIVSQYGHRLEYGKVVRRRSEDKPPESSQDSNNLRSESL